jgi:hypothetical protein
VLSKASWLQSPRIPIASLPQWGGKGVEGEKEEREIRAECKVLGVGAGFRQTRETWKLLSNMSGILLLRWVSRQGK